MPSVGYDVKRFIAHFFSQTLFHYLHSIVSIIHFKLSNIIYGAHI